MGLIHELVLNKNTFPDYHYKYQKGALLPPPVRSDQYSLNY